MLFLFLPFVDVAVRDILATLDVNDLLTHALKNFQEGAAADDPQVLQLASAYAEIVELFGGVGHNMLGNDNDESDEDVEE